MKRVLEPEVMESKEEAETFDEYQKKTMRNWWPLLLKKFNKLDINSNCKILDVAAGPANFSIMLAKQYNCFVTATDLSNEMLKVARKNVRAAKIQNKVKIIKDDAKKMKFKDGSFDFVFCRYTLHQIPNPLFVLNEIWRVTKPGGKIIILDILRKYQTKAQIEARQQKLERGYKRDKIKDWKKMLELSAQSRRAALTKSAILKLLKKSIFSNFKFKKGKRIVAFCVTAIKK